MKILINDSLENKDRLIKIFQQGGYERDHLIFVHSYEECKTFFETQLDRGKQILILLFLITIMMVVIIL